MEILLITVIFADGRILSARKASRLAQFVKIVWYKKDILCPSLTLQPFAQFRMGGYHPPAGNCRRFMMKINCINGIHLPK